MTDPSEPSGTFTFEEGERSGGLLPRAHPREWVVTGTRKEYLTLPSHSTPPTPTRREVLGTGEPLTDATTTDVSVGATRVTVRDGSLLPSVSPLRLLGSPIQVRRDSDEVEDSLVYFWGGRHNFHLGEHLSDSVGVGVT